MIESDSAEQNLLSATRAEAHYREELGKVAKLRGYLLPLGVAWLACAWGFGMTLAGGKAERRFLAAVGELGETASVLGLLIIPFVLWHLRKTVKEAESLHKFSVKEVAVARAMATATAAEPDPALGHRG